MSIKPVGIFETIFIVLLIGSIALMMTLFRGNSDSHNEVMYAILVALYSYVAWKFLFPSKGKRYFIFILIFNALCILISFIEVFYPQNRNSFNGMGQSYLVTLLLFPLFIIDIVIAKLNSRHRVDS